MHYGKLADKIRRGERIFGTMITSMSPVWPEKLKEAGLDFVFLDTEHHPADRVQLSYLYKAYDAARLPALTRIPTPDPCWATMALDAGSAGILAPYIESADEVRALAGAVKYRPLKGKRLRDVLENKIQLSQNESEYLSEYNRNRFLFINVESAEAIDRLDEMLAVPGLDGVIIGPHDLSISLSVPEQYDAPVFLAAVEGIIQKTLAHGKMVGNHFSFGIEQELNWVRTGMNVVLHSSDFALFFQALRADFTRLREAGNEIF